MAKKEIARDNPTVPVVQESKDVTEQEMRDGDAGKRYEVIPGGRSYTLTTIARYLNWIKPSNKEATNACRNAFNAYQKQPPFDLVTRTTWVTVASPRNVMC